MSQDAERPEWPEPVEKVGGMIAALISDMDGREGIIEVAAVPGAAAFWLSLTEAELERLYSVTVSPLVPWIRADVAHVPLIPLDGSAPALIAVVRYFPDLHEWRVERLGDLSPRSLGRPHLEVLS